MHPRTSPRTHHGYSDRQRATEPSSAVKAGAHVCPSWICGSSVPSRSLIRISTTLPAVGSSRVALTFGQARILTSDCFALADPIQADQKPIERGAGARPARVPRVALTLVPRQRTAASQQCGCLAGEPCKSLANLEATTRRSMPIALSEGAL